MNLTNLFRKNQSFNLPVKYKGILTQKEYNEILEICKAYFLENNQEISVQEDGEIRGEVDGVLQKWYLDNLVRFASRKSLSEKKTIIHEHFNKLKPNQEALNYLFLDFEYAFQFLRILLKGESFDIEDDIKDYVHRFDIPETTTFLVIEFEEKFHYLQKEDIEGWGKSEFELFEIAIKNIPDEEIQIKEYEFYERFSVFAFFSGDFSASLMLDINNRINYLIGTYGSLIAIPTKGTAYGHPIENGEIMELISALYPTIEQFYEEDPGNITTNFYWFFNGTFEKFPIEEEDDGFIIKLPENLSNLLKIDYN